MSDKIFDPLIFDPNSFSGGESTSATDGSGKGASRKSVDLAGGVILTGSSNVFIEGVPIALNNATVQSHGNSPHNFAVVAATTTKVFVNNIPVIRQGDRASCAHRASGSKKVYVG